MKVCVNSQAFLLTLNCNLFIIQIEVIMEYQKEILKLENLKKKIIDEKNKKNQAFLISDYCNILAYLDSLKVVDGEKMLGELPCSLMYYHHLVSCEQRAYCESYLKSIYDVNHINTELMSFYKEYPLKLLSLTYCNPIDLKEGLSLLNEFLNDLGEEFYLLFENIFNEGRVSIINNMLDEGNVYDATYTDKSYIILKSNGKDFDYEFISSFAHELGHCYEYSLNFKKSNLYALYPFAEVSSLFIQKLFDLFVINNHSYKDKALHSRMMWQNVLFKRTLLNDFVTIAFNNEAINNIDYATGYIDIEDKDVVMEKLSNLHMEALNEFCPTLDNYLYVLSDVVANNFVKIYNESKKDGLELFKRFLLNARNISINKYFSLNESLEESKKMIKEAYLFQKNCNL